MKRTFLSSAATALAWLADIAANLAVLFAPRSDCTCGFDCTVCAGTHTVRSRLHAFECCDCGTIYRAGFYEFEPPVNPWCPQHGDGGLP